MFSQIQHSYIKTKDLERLKNNLQKSIFFSFGSFYGRTAKQSGRPVNLPAQNGILTAIIET